MLVLQGFQNYRISFSHLPIIRINDLASFVNYLIFFLNFLV
nr:MAG TPA: hypothetical protein [Caudoviricetes sp.]